MENVTNFIEDLINNIFYTNLAGIPILTIVSLAIALLLGRRLINMII